MGQRHAAAVHAFGDRVAVVVDQNPARAAKLAQKYQAVAFGDLRDALASEISFTLGVIASSTMQHYQQTIDLLEREIPLLVEKPHRAPGQDPLPLKVAEDSKGYIFVGMTTRHWPGFQEIRKTLHSGELGEVLFYSDRMHYLLADETLPNWYFDPSLSGGGVLLTNGVHALDRVLVLLGEMPSLVSAHLRRVFPSHQCEDSAEIQLETARRAPVNLSMSWVPYEPKETGVMIHCSNGEAKLNMDGSWSVLTPSLVRSGPPLGTTDPFLLQWQAFRANEPGFGLSDLELTMGMIERIYEKSSRAQSD
jgi:predicted dehydrogenase